MNKLMVYAYTGVVITMLFWGSALRDPLIISPKRNHV